MTGKKRADGPWRANGHSRNGLLLHNQGCNAHHLANHMALDKLVNQLSLSLTGKKQELSVVINVPGPQFPHL